MIIHITRRSHFSASHRLFNPEWDDTKNSAVFGKCNNPNGHGHNYQMEVTVSGEPSLDTGMVIDLKELAQIVQDEIIEKVDHTNLNLDVPFLKGIIPTAENIAIAFWKILESKIPAGRLSAIKLYESENNLVEYRRD
jgi:6-pyruvoyltetrahydropterin/6-carboxytetrahydropterin synthase